jgi:O-antigen ligase
MTISTSNEPAAGTTLSRAPADANADAANAAANAAAAAAAVTKRRPGGGSRPSSAAASSSSRAPVAPARTLAGRFALLLVCLAVVFSALAFGTVHAWSLAIFQAGAGLVVLLWALDAWGTRSLRVSKNVLQLPLWGLFAVGLFQLLPPARSLDPYATRMTLVQTAALAVYFAAALAFIDTPRRLRLVVRTLVLFGSLLAVFGLLQYFLNPAQIYWLRQPQYALPFGPFVNRHHFAAYMELTIGLPLGLLLSGAIKRELLVLYVFAVVLMAIALVATASRGGAVSLGAQLVFAVAVAAFMRARSSRGRGGGEEAGGRAQSFFARAGLQLAFGVALLVGVLIFGGEELIDRTVGTLSSENITTGRAEFWRGTKEIIRERPLLGAGLGAFGVAYTRHDVSSGAARLEQAHNDYLQIFADAGLVGGLLGLVFVAALFRMAFARMASHDKFRRGVALGALAGCFGTLVHSLFDFSLHLAANALLFLVLAALATTGGGVEEPDSGRRGGGGRRRRRRSGGSDRSARAGQDSGGGAAGEVAA